MGGNAGPGRLVYLSGIDFPHQKARAIQVINTCHALAAVGWDVTLVVGRRAPGAPSSYLPRYGLQPLENLRIVALTVFHLSARAPRSIQAMYTRLWNWSYLLGCLALLPSLIRLRPIGVMVRDYRLAWLLLGTQRLHRLRVIFEVHGLPSVEHCERDSQSHQDQREAVRLRQLESSVFRASWKLLTITECLRQRLLRDYQCEAERVVTIPDATRGPLQPQPKQVRTNGGAKSLRLIYVGQLYPWKGVDLLLRAMTNLPNAELWIVGGLDEDEQLARLRRLADALALAGRVRFLGPRPYSEVRGILAEADIALLPLAEGIVARCFTSPLKLFDYMAAGLPIVAVDYPTVREVLSHEHNALLVEPASPESFASAVRRLANDPNLAMRLGKQARLDAASHTWEQRADRISRALDVRLPIQPAAMPTG